MEGGFFSFLVQPYLVVGKNVYLPFFPFQNGRLHCIRLIFVPLYFGCCGGGGERKVPGLLVRRSLGWGGAMSASVAEIVRCPEIVDSEWSPVIGWVSLQEGEDSSRVGRRIPSHL